jgi:hypothetical protein
VRISGAIKCSTTGRGSGPTLSATSVVFTAPPVETTLSATSVVFTPPPVETTIATTRSVTALPVWEYYYFTITW